MPKITIGVIGGAVADEAAYKLAEEVGKHIALNGADLVCGGMGGIMEAASKGAKESGGRVIGILPTESKSDANEFVSTAIPTGMGVGRNALIIKTADTLIAFPGSYGTLSEIALALNLNKPVIRMPGSWDISKIGFVKSEIFKEAFDATEAIGLALSSI